MSKLITKILTEKSSRTNIAMVALTAAAMSPWDTLA